MALLDDIFAAGNTPWARSMMAQMLGDPNADLRAVAPPPRQAPAPAPRPETEPTAASVPQSPAAQPTHAAPQRPDLSGGGGPNVMASVLRGVGGPLGALGAAMEQSAASEKQTKLRNDTYDMLLRRGVDSDTARMAVTDPSVGKVVIPRALGLGGASDATKNAPTGYMWNDPTDQSKGVRQIPGFAPKPDPIETAMRKEEFKADSKTMAELEKSGNVARDTLDDINRLRNARKAVGYEGGFFTGARTFLGKNLPDGIGVVGIPGIPSQEEAGRAEEVESIATNLQLKFTEKTKGAISNREMELFGRATPGMSMSDAGAENVMDAFEAGATKAREKPKFFEAYRRAHGTLDGADSAWDSFVESKPVLTDDGKGGYSVNKKNATAWGDFVKPATKAQTQQAMPPIPGARQAPDGNFYVEDPNRPGKYLMVSP